REWTYVIRIDPCIDGKCDRQIHLRVVSENVVLTIETDCLSDFSRVKRRWIKRFCAEAVLNLVQVPVKRPPCHHIGRRRGASLALAGTTGRSDRLNLPVCQRAIEDFHFIEQTVKRNISLGPT